MTNLFHQKRGLFIFLLVTLCSAVASGVTAETIDLSDGDFEQAGANWIEWRDYSNRPIVVTNAPNLPVTPRSGSYFAWLGGAHNLDPSTQNNQNRLIYGYYILLPNETPTQLHFWYWSEFLCLSEEWYGVGVFRMSGSQEVSQDDRSVLPENLIA